MAWWDGSIRITYLMDVELWVGWDWNGVLMFTGWSTFRIIWMDDASWCYNKWADGMGLVGWLVGWG